MPAAARCTTVNAEFEILGKIQQFLFFGDSLSLLFCSVASLATTESWVIDGVFGAVFLSHSFIIAQVAVDSRGRYGYNGWYESSDELDYYWRSYSPLGVEGLVVFLS